MTEMKIETTLNRSFLYSALYLSNSIISAEKDVSVEGCMFTDGLGDFHAGIVLLPISGTDMGFTSFPTGRFTTVHLL